jgi:predicted RNase H-like nuclease (RuvC/YqgF family)
MRDVTPVTGSDVSNAGLSPAPPQITLNISPKVSITSSQYLGPYSLSEVKVVEEEEEEEREEEKGTRGQRKAEKRPLSPDSEKEKKLKKRMQNIRSREQRKAKQARELEELEHGNLKLQADRERFEQERAQFEARVHDMTRYDARCVSCGGHVCPVLTFERGTSPGPTLSYVEHVSAMIHA